MKVWVGALAALVLGVGAVASVAAEPPTKETSPWWAHVKVLADTGLQGRLTGSPGYQKAADYVAARFKQYGLKPGGTAGYFQPVDFEVQTIDRAASRVAFTLPDGTVRDEPDLAVVAAGNQQPGSLKAPLVFVGYGLSLPEAGYDDFAGVDLKGKVAVMLRGGPASISGALRAHSTAEALARRLEAAGAVGLITLTAPPQLEIPWTRTLANASQPGMYLSDPALRRFQGPFFTASLDPARSDMLFAGAEHSFAEMVTEAVANRPLPHFELKTTVEANVVATISKVTSSNVVGVLPGSDPKLAPEAVVLSAHLDHLGVGPPADGRDGVFRGALDNATGVATLLETARAMQRTHARPKRSIVFVAVCGEEKGLLGSRYFASKPSVFAGRLVADINMDMFLPLVPLRQLVGLGEGESTLGAQARAAAAAHGLALVPDPQPARLAFTRSDQYSFVRMGIPALKLDFAPLGPEEEKTFADWRHQRYHGQMDDLEQPVDVAAAHAYNGFLLDLILRIANDPARPQWLDGSFFKRFAR